MHAIGGGERAAVERIRGLLPPAPAGEVWIGDDTAVVPSPSGSLLLATDMVVEDVHFDLSFEALDVVGWTAMARSLSDVAAMGGLPLHAVVAVAGPPATDLDLLYGGLGECAAAFGCSIVGGDLSGGRTLTVAVAVTGTIADGGHAVLRNGAGPGDAIFVTGPLGAGASARRRRTPRRPTPRIDGGEAARRAGATAMIDVSDGLVADLGRLADASAVGFALDDVPLAAGATVDDALGGGDDYELVFCAPSVGPAVALGFPGPGVGTFIGRCTDDPSERTLRGQPLPALGWEHHWS